ncbi:MGMT family protein [Coprobacter tertius]|uniref:MGMT family protein n=1 Tax=Coprobacter tertius TaxID=2944915 RepID=A0ABT1MJL4_9BACT|nr:MGMT family protein [Coprobacter tertius]MCP9612807.1 MGMT family protein [Coprobacter tertius]
MNITDFDKEVYQVVREIPKGYVTTYGEIARLIGYPQLSRRVGQALSHAPSSLNLPCHRVVNCQGRLVPGWEQQKILLEQEGVVFKRNGCVNMKNSSWNLSIVEI